MSNPFYNHSSGVPATQTRGTSLSLRAELDLIGAGFDAVAASTIIQDQWVLYGPTSTYINATSFSVVGDQTSTFQVGRRIKTVNTGGTVYSTITASVYSAATTVTLAHDSGSLDTGLASVRYGLLSVLNPAIPTIPVAYGGTGATATTGTGNNVLSNSPTLVTPALGTPSALVATNATGTASGLTAGNVTTNANLTGDVTSVGNATTLTNAPVIAKVLTGYTSGAGTVAATDSILQAIQKLNGNDALRETSTNKNASGGYAGLTLFKLNLRNAADTITSWFTTAATVARTWTMPDKDGTVAMTSDITGTNSGTNTGDNAANTTYASDYRAANFVAGTNYVAPGGALGTPSSGVATNLTGTSAGLTAGNVTTNANLTGPVTSTGNATAIANGAITNAMLANAAVANLSGTNTGDQTTVSGNSGSTNALKSATTTVDVVSATAPTTGQVLTATDSTHATWQTPSAGGGGVGSSLYLNATQGGF